MIEPETERTQGPAARRLRDGRVLIVGVGALGCPAAVQLADAGVGTLVLVDPDRVELSNLHRQILHTTSGIGTPKVLSAAAALRRRSPDLRVVTHAEALTAHNAAQLFPPADFIIDATDGVAAKFLINDAAVRWQRPFSHAGILGFLGQTMTVLPGRSACYRCLFPEPPPPDEIPTCQEAGVVGPIAGLIGSLQAAEAIKFLTGSGELASDRLITYDALTDRWRRVRLARNPRCPICAHLSAAAGSGGSPAARSLEAADAAGYGGGS
jgi:molybdopterin/thiamine biosynthesis adenylyltransferase